MFSSSWISVEGLVRTMSSSGSSRVSGIGMLWVSSVGGGVTEPRLKNFLMDWITCSNLEEVTSPEGVLGSVTVEGSGLSRRLALTHSGTSKLGQALLANCLWP